LANWKENKMLGIIAGAIALIAVGVTISISVNKNSISKEEMVEIEKTNAMVEAEMRKEVDGAGI